MALTRITKGVIKPNENYDTHNINSTGIVTAIGLDINGNADISGNLSVGGVLTYEDVTSIDSVGIITAQKDIHVGAGISVVGVGSFGSLDISGDIDVDGHTNLDNVSVAGVTTITSSTYPLNVHADTAYQGILVNGNNAPTLGFNTGDNATPSWKIGLSGSNHTSLSISEGTGNNNRFTLSSGGGAHLSGTLVAEHLGIDGYLYHNSDTNTKLQFGIDTIDLQTGGSSRLKAENSGVVVTGILTATSLDVSTDLDVDGHTNLDNVSIAGVTTITGALHADGFSTVGGEIAINGTVPRIGFTDSNANSDFRIKVDGGSFQIEDITNSSADRLTINSSGNVSITNDLDVDGHTNLDNVSVAGVTTIASNTTIGGNLTVNGTNTILNTITYVKGGEGADGILAIYADEGDDPADMWRLKSGTDGTFKLDNYAGGAWETNIKAVGNGAVELYHNGTKKFETTSNGAAVSNIQNNQGLDLNGVGNNTCIRFMSTGSSPGHAFRIAYHSLTNYLYGSPALTFDKTDTSGNFDSHIAGISDGGFHLADNKKLHLGNKMSASGDLQIYHDGSHSYIDDSGTGNLYIQSNHVNIDSKNGEQFINCFQDGAVELYHDSSERLSTTSTGVHVTGEVAASQDYPNYRPTLDFNFASTKKLDSRISFARQGTASYYDEFGKVKFAADNEPRFDHDPDTGECKGLLIESASANLIDGSADEGTDTRGVYSTLGNGFAINELVSDIVRPTGTPGLVRRMKSHASGNSGGRWGGYNGSGGSPYAASFWVRSVTGTSQVGIDVNDQGYNATTVGTEWVRVKAVGTTSNNYDFMDITFPNTSDDVYVWGIQLEQNPFVSSYIRGAKNSNTAYRGADIANIDGEEFAEFYNDTEHTTVMFGQRAGNVAGADGRLYTISDGTSSQVAPDWDFNDGTNLRFSTNVGGNSQTLQEISSWSGIDEEFKIAAGIALNNQIGVVNGTAIAAADTSCAMPTGVDRLFFGLRGNGNNQGSLTIKRFMFYPKRLPDSQLVTLTSQ